MNGGMIHEHCLNEPERLGRSLGLHTRRQVCVPSCGYIDLTIEGNGLRIAIEAELTSKRVSRDLLKADALFADELWIVVPNAQTARIVRVRLRELNPTKENNDVFVLTLVQAITRLRLCFSDYFPTIVKQKTKTERS